MAREEWGEVGTGEIQVDGGTAELLADADRPGGWMLSLDRIPQSYVDLDDPSYLEFEYMQRIGEVLDAVAPPQERLRVTHLGGGAGTIVRYVAHSRPGSPQIVYEPDAALTALVRQKLPFRRDVRVRIRPVDARTGIGALAADSADVVVLDAFAGARTPAELTTTEFFADVARVLGERGVLIANLADGGPLGYLRRVIASASMSFTQMTMALDPAVRSGKRFGNIVFVASGAPLPMVELRRAAAAAMFPVALVDGAQLATLIRSARPFSDSDAERSPSPPNDSWRRLS